MGSFTPMCFQLMLGHTTVAFHKSASRPLLKIVGFEAKGPWPNKEAEGDIGCSRVFQKLKAEPEILSSIR
jgi:hypothetical protein